MTFEELKKISSHLYAPALALERVFTHKWRRYLKYAFFTLFVICTSFSLIFYLFNVLGIETPYDILLPKLYGITLLFSVVWSVMFCLDAFYYSYYYLEVKNRSFYIDFDLAKVINSISSNDITAEFFRSSIGKLILNRSGIKLSDFNAFIKSRKSIVSSEELNFAVDDYEIDLGDFAVSILKLDKEFAEFLFRYGIQEKELRGIGDWIIELNDHTTNLERWWSAENLSRYPSIGRDWSYGQIYTLKKYQRQLISGLSRHYRIHSSYGVKELVELEAVLSRTRDANVALVGNDEAGMLQIVSHLSQMIDEGSVVSRLKHKRVILFDNDKLIASNGSKSEFEKEFINIMIEAINAGNVLLVIENFPSLIISCQSIGVDLPTLFEPYLSSPNLQVIALTNNEQFHEFIEKNPILSQHFENILIKEIDDTNTIKVLENELVRFERNGLFFTYQALESIVEGAERYFSNGIMPDKAIDLLLEIAPKLIYERKSLVEKKDILRLVETKTGIPVGEINAEEKDKLLNLEQILHKRIVGQDEAVETISNAVRRARSGITNPNRPLGSFLFLGPTGVGKTETTKALADVFFGEKAKILRLDMSEYSAFDAVSKLIGSFETKQAGVLSNMILENQYGVLLLDEFEKTTKEVMNLFLQILDEGFFSDMNGKKISARNLIIIATSNAGSKLIWEAMQRGDDLVKAKGSILDSLIKTGLFKPELLNRFDGVVLFHPLNDSHLRKIAEMMLNCLHERLAEQGINLVINDNLVNYVVSFGTDPKFGARPMNRAIQEKVEEIVAKKIISGSIPKGERVELSAEELS